MEKLLDLLEEEEIRREIYKWVREESMALHNHRGPDPKTPRKKRNRKPGSGDCA